MKARFALGFALVAWTTVAGADVAAQALGSQSCSAERVLNETDCGVRWKCGASSRLVISKKGCVDDARVLFHEEAKSLKFPARAGDGTTFDVFALAGMGSGDTVQELLVVVSRGAEAKGFSEILVDDSKTFQITDAPTGSALVVTVPPVGKESGTRWTITMNGAVPTTIPAARTTKRETLTMRGRVEMGSHADGFGHNVFEPGKGGVHIDEEGSCNLDKLENGNAELVLDRVYRGDGSSAYECKSAKKIGALADPPRPSLCGRYDVLSKSLQYAERVEFRDKRTGLAWAQIKPSGLGALSYYDAASRCRDVGKELGRAMRLPTRDEAIALSGQRDFCRALWPDGFLTWTDAAPGVRQSLVVDAYGGSKPGPIQENTGYPIGLGFLCVQK